ncbi:MAG: hypothetical protein WCO43_03945 [Chitinophagia bacterium]
MLNRIKLFGLVVFVLVSCKKYSDSDCPSPPYFIPPESLFFQVRQNSKKLDNYSLDWSRLFYIKNSQRFYLEKRDFKRAVNDLSSNYMAYDSGVLVAGWSVALLSADDNIKIFYLEYPNGNIDTIGIDYRHYNNCEIDTSRCKCIYPRFDIKFNGNTAYTNKIVTDQQIYIFNKN